MRAAVYRKYGPPDVVRIEELPTPTPGPSEVLVRIRASTVSSADWRARSLEAPAGFGLFMRPVFGITGPRKPILGSEFAGTIEAVGSAVTRFAPGEEVIGFPGFALGSHAAYRTMPESGRLVRKPANLGFEEAAALCFGGATALHFLRDLGKVRPGETVLVIGAAGAVGSAAVQLARHFGARVTGVASTRNQELVGQLGADRVIDYTRTDLRADGARYDVILDTVGAATFAACESMLTDGGRLLLCAAGLPQMIGSALASLRSRKRVLMGTAPERLEDLRTLVELAAAGHFRPLVDRCYPLEEIASAHAYVATGHKRGSVVIKMEDRAAAMQAC